MRYRLMATYRGSPFEAGIGPRDGDIVLFAACPPPEELGFEPATGHWRKQLPIGDVQAVWESRPVGTFRGERCMVLDDLGDRLHIGYLGHDGYRAEQLGYWQVDRGVFELVAPRADVADIIEERTEYPRQTEPGQRPSGPPSGGYAVQPGHRPASDTASTGNRSDTGSFATTSSFPKTDSFQDTGSFSRQRAPGTASYATGAYPAGSGPALPPPGPGNAGFAAPGHDLPPAEMAPAPTSAYPPPASDNGNSIAIPPAVEPPLPLEAEAMRAASASRRPRQSPRRSPTAASADLLAPVQPASALVRPVAAPVQPGPVQPVPTAAQAAQSVTPPVSRPRRSARRRMATERLFAELASQAGIPAGSYAVGDEVEGALCLVQTEDGFEVFHSANGARHESQVFGTEEAACFYLFGVLAAESVRNGSLVHVDPGDPAFALSAVTGTTAP